MGTLVLDPHVERKVRAERAASGADRWDEVWEGVYVMSPLPNNEHQEVVGKLTTVLEISLGWTGLGDVRPGVNVSDRDDDWTQNYRCPDVAVFLRGGQGDQPRHVLARRPRLRGRGRQPRRPRPRQDPVLLPGRRPRAAGDRSRPLGARDVPAPGRTAYPGRDIHRGEARRAGQRGRAPDVPPCPGAARPRIEVAHSDGEPRWMV